jgi:hypothetical protein
MKVIIAGGREFSDYRLLKGSCDYYLHNLIERGENIEIVSGTARGADTLGERYAQERGFKIRRFPADWGRLGLVAGHIRNAQMADYADLLIAFWDEISGGTKNMIDTAREKGLRVRVVRYNT